MMYNQKVYRKNLIQNTLAACGNAFTRRTMTNRYDEYTYLY
jgi:hypothetical protein